MPELTNAYQEQMADIAERAAAMKRALVEPFRTDDGFLGNETTAEIKHRDAVLESAISDTAYSMTQGGKMIAGCHARALQAYEKSHGCLPPDDLLASAHKTIENAILVSNGKASAGGIFESADMSTTDGILMRDRLISLVLPVLLRSITADMVTYIPGEFNQSEFFRIRRVAGSTFGSLHKGDIIDYDYSGLYSVMDQRAELGTGDGSTTTFNFQSPATTSGHYPLKKKRCRIWVDRKQVAQDDGNGVLSGSYQDATGVIVVSGTVDYAAGTISASFTRAPENNVSLHIGYDVDIEKDPTLIPRVDHQMFSRVMYPHESAITGDATIQAIWTLRRELGQDIDNLTMQGLRNLLAADKDRKHLHDMMFHTQQSVDWVRTRPDALTQRDHYETLQSAFLDVDSKLMKGNGVSGLVGVVAGSNACNLMRYLPEPWFKPDAGYRSIGQPHYVGIVFGQWRLYCNPHQEDSWGCLCFGRGPDHGQTAYVAGDAVPALTFKHPILGDLTQKATMWDLAYRDMQPFDGEKYLCKLNMIEG